MVSTYGLVAGMLISLALVSVEDTTTLKGWLSDKGCAQAKVKGEEVTPNGTTCVKKCLEDGAEAVFVHPESRTLFALRDYPALKDDVGFHLQITGVVDETTRTIAVRSVKRLDPIVNVCALPKKK